MSEVPITPKPKLSCSIAMCRNYNNPYSSVELYQLPSSSVQRQKFSDILGIPYSVAEQDTARVCALHFKSKLLNNNNSGNAYKLYSTPVMQTVKESSVANPSNVSTFGTNATTFTNYNLGGGQPIKFFLQKTVSNTSSSIPISATSLLKATSSISSSTNSISSSTSSISSATSLISSLTSSISGSTSSISGSTSSLLRSTDKVVSCHTISQEDKIFSLDEDLSNNDHPQEERTDAQLDLQCNEELLSQPQLNSYYSDLVSFITANSIVKNIPPQVKSATVSTQTDPVTILINDRIHPQPSTSATASKSYALNSAQTLPSGSSQIEDEIILIEPSPSTPVADNASPKVTQSSCIEKSNLLLNSVQISHGSSKENVTVAGSSNPLISLANLATNAYHVTTISSTTIPVSTVTTTISTGDKSRLFSYLSQKPSVAAAAPVTAPPIIFNLKPPPPYVSSEKGETIAPSLPKQVFPTSNFPSNVQPQTLTSASTALLSLANQSNQLIRTTSGLAMTTSTPSGIPFQNQVRFEPNLPAYQMPQRYQLISLSDNPRMGALSSFGQSMDQHLMNEDNPYSSPYSSSHFNSQEFQNYTATNIGDTPFQLLIQKNDQPNMLYSNNFPVQGATLAGYNTATSLPRFPVATQNYSDKDADLLGLCNVTTVYGNDTPPQPATPVDQTPPNPNAAGDAQQNLTFGSVLENFSIIDYAEDGSTRSGIESPFISGSDSSQNSLGPLIVDVISATEGAKEYYIGDKIPNILLDKCRKETMDKRKKDENQKHLTYIPDNKVYAVGDRIPNVLFSESKKGEEKKKELQTTYGKDNEADSADVHKNTHGSLQAVKLHNSVFSLQTSIPIIPNGSEKCTDTHTLLSLRVPTGRIGSEDANTLRQRLRAEKYITCSVWWLVRRNYMPMIDPCSCKSHAFKVNRSSKHSDGYCWQCANPACHKEEPIRRPKFFESFKSYTLENLLLLTYHWACQTSIEEIVMEVDMDYEKIFAYFQALQELCHQVSLKKCKLGPTPDSMVEAALVKLGNFFVIGAYDRKTHYTRLEAISQLDAYSTTVHIRLLENWLNQKAVLVTDQKISDDFLKGIKKLQAFPTITSPLAKEAHILNVSKYLITHLTSIFGKVNQNHLSLEVVKGFLHELQWRCKYGKFLDMSFWSIMNHIRDLNDNEEVKITAKPGDLNTNSYCKKMKGVLKARWGPSDADEKVGGGMKVKRNEVLKLNLKVQPSTKSYSKVIQLPAANKVQTSYVTAANKVQTSYVTAANKVQTSYVTTANKVQTSYVTAANASELFQDVPEIPGGSSNINSKSLLAIKIRCEDSTPPGVYKPNATSLGLQLRTEGFISDPVKWLVKRGYVRGTGPCYVCGDTSLLREHSKYKDGCSWSCQNKICKFENMFRRPLFFARFNEQPMAQVAAMIFHWTVQSDYNIVTSDVPLDYLKMSHAWRAFQVLCSSALKREHFKVGGEGHIVEVALVQYGRIYVLGARHRITKRTLLKCFPVEMKDQVELVHETLRSWIVPKSYVVINSTPLFRLSTHYKVFPADTSITDITSSSLHVLNITSYLLKHVFEMFGHLRAGLVRPQLMQMYLDELMWRERFGKLPNLAFAKIMYEIFYHEKHSGSLLPLHHTVKELLDEEPTAVCQKIAVVVLQRIPQTVLKYYNCLPIDCATEKAPSPVKKIPQSGNESSDSSTGDSSSSGDELLSQLTEKSKDGILHNNKRKISKGSKGGTTQKALVQSHSDEEWSNSTADEESSSSEDESLHNPVSKPGDSLLRNISKRQISRSSSSSNNPSGAAKNTVLPNPTKVLEVVPNLPSDDLPVTNSVQPLVIKMNKNRQKFQSYLKSEFLRAKYKKQRSRKFNVRRLSRKTPPKKSNSDLSQPVVSGVVVKNETEEEPGPSGFCQSVNSESAGGAILVKRRSAMLRRLENTEKQICIECGKEVIFEHFMKQFSCTDCKNIVYTTCCGNAFFEHRSALLFGKRLPRREKVGHGLHRSRTLLRTAVCPCGFKSKIGNHIASHLVKCQQTSCFYNDGS